MILKAPTLDLYAHKEQHLSDPFGKNPVVQYLLDFLLLRIRSSSSSLQKPGYLK
jgi:hypothetical protein